MSDIFGTILSGDGVGIFGFDTSSQWGIFLDGAQVVQADSVRSFAFKQDWPISNYPVEDGGFQSYDKVQLPFEPRVVFQSGGDEANRQALLDSIAAIAGDLNLYDVVTPEAVYTSCNITHYDYERSATNGVGLLKVTVHLEEVRVTAQAQFNSATPLANTVSPTAQDQTNNGTVQPNVPATSPNIGTAAILPANFAGSVT